AVEDKLTELRRAAEAQVRAGDERLLAVGHRMRQAAADPALPEVGTPHPATARTGGTPAATVPEQGPRARVPAPRGSAEPALGPGDAGLAEAVLEWAALARTNARERRDIAEAAVHAAEAAHRAARQRADGTRDLAALQRRHADARQRADAFAEGAAEREDVRRRLDRARAAEAVVPVLALRDRAEQEHRAAAEAERRARAALPEAHRDASPERLAALEHALREELGALSAARRAEERAAGITGELAALDREARADEEVLAETDEWLASWEAQRDRHRRRVEDAQEAVGRAERLGGQLEPARRTLDAARRRDALAREAAEAEARRPAARDRAARAREDWLDLKERRIDGMAAELAARLSAGTPCAVCGATEHPAPARAEAGHVDRAAEEAALEEYQRAEAARETADALVRSLHRELAAVTEAAGPAPVAELADALQELETSFARARDASGDLLAAREALDAAEREHERRAAARQDAGMRAAARTSRRENLERELAGLEEELTRARGGETSVARRAALLERRLTGLTGRATVGVAWRSRKRGSGPRPWRDTRAQLPT
ncbi:SMC family ATPase, partial [Streptomyces sp. NPDC049577]